MLSVITLDANYVFVVRLSDLRSTTICNGSHKIPAHHLFFFYFLMDAKGQLLFYSDKLVANCGFVVVFSDLQSMVHCGVVIVYDSFVYVLTFLQMLGVNSALFAHNFCLLTVSLW